MSKISLIFPVGWPDRPKDGRGKSFGGHDGHGIIRVSLNPPPDVSKYKTPKEALDGIYESLGLDVGKVIISQDAVNGVGPYRVIVGKHDRFGLVAIVLMYGKVFVTVTYEMNELGMAQKDISHLMETCTKIEIKESV